MFATAQALAKAALLQRHPKADPAKLKRLLFLHFYGNDFEPKERERIASALERRARIHTRGRKPLIARAVREKEKTYGRKRKTEHHRRLPR